MCDASFLVALQGLMVFHVQATTPQLLPASMSWQPTLEAMPPASRCLARHPSAATPASSPNPPPSLTPTPPHPSPSLLPSHSPPPGVLRHQAGPPHVLPPPRRVRPMSHPSPAACPATHDSALQVSIQLPDLDSTLLTARSFQADLLCAKAGILLVSDS